MLKTVSGWRYVVELSMGYDSAVFTSKDLYPSQGAAIDAMRAAYPEDDYPDAKRSVMADDEPVIA